MRYKGLRRWKGYFTGHGYYTSHDDHTIITKKSDLYINYPGSHSTIITKRINHIIIIHVRSGTGYYS